MRIAFRCDGDDRIGAGHVARCLQIARAFEAAGDDVLFVGAHAGAAASLLGAAGMRRAPAAAGEAGVPADVDAAIVDHYDIAPAEVEALAGRVPCAVVDDGDRAPRVTAALCYHLDAPERYATPDGTVPILGAEYAPVRPECVGLRRERGGFERVLVTLGGSVHGAPLLEAIADGLADAGAREVFVASSGDRPAGLAASVGWGFEGGGLSERIHWADAAVSAAGSTPYDLACAGVPALLLAIADNQAPIARAFDEHGVAIGLDARDGLPAELLGAALGRLADPQERARLAAAGPAAVDGRGAIRARDALAAAFSGSRIPPI